MLWWSNITDQQQKWFFGYFYVTAVPLDCNNIISATQGNSHITRNSRNIYNITERTHVPRRTCYHGNASICSYRHWHCHWPKFFYQPVQSHQSSLPSVSPTFARQLEQLRQAHYISFQEHPCCRSANSCPKRVQHPTWPKVSLRLQCTQTLKYGHGPGLSNAGFSWSFKKHKLSETDFCTICGTSIDEQVTDCNSLELHWFLKKETTRLWFCMFHQLQSTSKTGEEVSAEQLHTGWLWWVNLSQIFESCSIFWLLWWLEAVAYLAAWMPLQRPKMPLTHSGSTKIKVE